APPVPPRPAPPPTLPKPTPPAPRDVSHLSALVQQYFRGGEIVPLNQYFDLRTLSGRQLRALTVTGQSHYGNGSVTLCVSSGCSFYTLATVPSSYQWKLQEPTEGRALSWRIAVNGEIYIERIDMELED
ncbi:MAG: hypothetical protein ACXVCG_14435, partial [Bdellovibrionota bacterium]